MPGMPSSYKTLLEQGGITPKSSAQGSIVVFSTITVRIFRPCSSHKLSSTGSKVQFKIILPGPDIRAVPGNQKRQIPHYENLPSLGVFFNHLKLLIYLPLQP